MSYQLTLQDLVTQTYQRALSSMREETDTLGANVMAGATSLSLSAGQSLGSIAPGAIIQVDWELFYVTAASTPASISVIPGYYDTTTAAHTAGAIILVNPRFPYQDIVNAINQELDDLSTPSNGLFQALEVTLSTNPVLIGYDMTDINTGVAVAPENLIDILQVRTHEFGPAQIWPLIPMRGVKLDRNASTSFFPSGMSLKIYDQKNYFPGQPIIVSYKAPYNINSMQEYVPLTNPTDNVQSVSGLHPQAHDILVLGAAVRVIEFREIKRAFTEDQPQPRSATEVPVGSSLESIKQIMMHRQQRIDAERSRLERQWNMAWGR